MRYKDDWKNVAYSTITKGRPDLGMPTWGGILPDEEIKAIVEFLVTVQQNGVKLLSYSTDCVTAVGFFVPLIPLLGMFSGMKKAG
jgi:hypothetical protein